MRPEQRARQLATLTALATTLAEGETRTLEQLDEWSQTIPPRGDPGPRGKGSHSDPTQSAHRDTFRDTTTTYHQHLRTIDDHLNQALKAARQAERIIVTTRAVAVTDPTIPCKSCARQHDHHGQPLRVPAHLRVELCQWCLRYQGEHGCWPPLPVLRVHHSGVRVTPLVIARLTRGDAA